MTQKSETKKPGPNKPLLCKDCGLIMDLELIEDKLVWVCPACLKTINKR